MAKKSKGAKKKAATKKPTLASVSAELELVKAELADLKESVGEEQEVTTSIDGPRRSEVAVDAQVIPMSGEHSRSGKRKVKLQRPKVDADLLLRGQVGTSTTFKITINGKTQTKTFVTTSEKQHKNFNFDFSDFGL